MIAVDDRASAPGRRLHPQATAEQIALDREAWPSHDLSDALTRACQTIVSMGLAPERELELVQVWNEDLDQLDVD